MREPGPPEGLETALAVVAYQWAVHGEELAVADALDAVEALLAAAAALPRELVPLAELYPAVARLAALSMGLLASIGDPDEVDGLSGFEGFTYWRESR